MDLLIGTITNLIDLGHRILMYGVGAFYGHPEPIYRVADLRL
jgi:hypothetical protein